MNALRLVLITLTLGIYLQCTSLSLVFAQSDTWNNVFDFMIQDACVNKTNQILTEITPLDKQNRCLQRRNLLPGEVLLYHKHDWPGEEDRRRLPNGYMRSDSFPYDSKALGKLAVQTFDFGGGVRVFKQFDKGDGGQVVAFSKNSGSIILTEDGGRGLQLMTGPKCTEGSVSPNFLLDSWLIGDERAEALASGESVSTLRIVTDSACPTAFDKSFTSWHFADHRYRVSMEGTLSNPLQTLISTHFGGSSRAAADHLERFYFTRELGWTRWERWQNIKHSKDVERDLNRAIKFASSGRCQTLEPPPTSDWKLLDCREWTNIVTHDVKGGDKPDFWIDRLVKDPLSRSIFEK